MATEKQFLKHSGVIALVSPEGSLVSYSEGFPANPFSVTDRDYFRFHRDHPSDVTFIGEPIVGRVYGKPSLTMSKALRRQDGGFDGLILITMPIDYFLELFNGAASPTDVAQFLREDGKVVVNVPYREGSAVMPEWFAKAVEENAKAGVVSYRSMPEGVDRLIAYRKVGEFPFYVTYGVDERILLTGWRQSVRVYGSVLAIALAACTAAAFSGAPPFHCADAFERIPAGSERAASFFAGRGAPLDCAGICMTRPRQHLVGAAMELENVKSRMPDRRQGNITVAEAYSRSDFTEQRGTSDALLFAASADAGRIGIAECTGTACGWF